MIFWISLIILIFAPSLSIHFSAKRTLKKRQAEWERKIQEIRGQLGLEEK